MPDTILRYGGGPTPLDFHVIDNSSCSDQSTQR